MLVKKTRLLIVACTVLAGIIGAAAASLHSNTPATDSTIPGVPTTLPVSSETLSLEQEYALSRTFSGQVQASRQADLGFERGGRLIRVLVDEGDVVSKGQLLAELDTDRLRAQRAELEAAKAEAEARLSLARVTTQRFTDVINKGGVSRQALDEAREAERAAEAALNLASQRILTIEVELGKTRLTAPFEATVVSRMADEGRVLDMGRPVITLLERNIPEVSIGVAGHTLEQLQTGARYTLTWRQQPLQATLRALLPLRSSATRTVQALFDPIDAPEGMLPGDLVTVSLEKTIRQPGFWVPLSALTEGERGLWGLLVIKPRESKPSINGNVFLIERHNVDFIHQDGDRVFIGATLGDGDKFVSSGVHRVVPGQLVHLPGDIATAEVAAQ